MNLSSFMDISLIVEKIQKHWYIYLFLLCTISFGIYLFNTSLMGADTWFYVGQVCDKSLIDFRDPLFSQVLLLMPCNFVAIKLYLFVLFLISMFTMSKIGELYFKDYGAILGVITGFLTLYILEFQVFENDTLGFTLFFISLYFAIKYSRTHTKWIDLNSLLSLVFAVAAGLAWRGVVYFLIPLTIFNPLTIIVAVPVISSHFEEFWWFLGGNGDVIMEQTAWVAFIYYGITTFFLFGMLKTPKKEVLAFILMCIPGIFVQKLFILAIPFISIITLHAIKSLKKYQDTLIPALIVFALFMSIYWGMHTVNAFPTQADIDLVKFTKTQTDTIQNTFGVGYLFEDYGLKVSSRGGTIGAGDYNCIGYVVEHPQVARCDCDVLRESDFLILEFCD